MPSKRIKVLKFLTHFGVGGTERQFLYAAQGLDRTRFDVQVACLARIGPLLKDLEGQGVPISEYPAKSLYGYKTLRCQLRLIRDVRRRGIQIIHAYGFYPNLFAIWPAVAGTNCVTIASVRDMGLFSDRGKMRRMAQAVVCRLADCVVVNSNAVRDWLVGEGLGHCDIRVIPNGIAIPERTGYRKEYPVRSEFKIDRTAPLIAVIGRLIKTKGIGYFLEAAASIVDRFPTARFLVVGGACAEPEHRVDLQKKAVDLNLKDRVIFAGQRNDVPQILQEVDISVLPSLSESFSNAVLESMAHGLPTIATRVGGTPELIADGVNGVLVPPRDSAAIARAVITLLESPELARRLGESAREKVVREYSLERLLQRTEDLYTSLLERRGFAPFEAVKGVEV